MTDRKNPPVDVIRVGYFLTEARTALSGEITPYDGNAVAYGYAYLTSATNAVPAARESLKRDLENRQMAPSPGLYDIDEACIRLREFVSAPYQDPMERRAISNLIGRGHQKLARMLMQFGFRSITDQDFKKLARDENLPGGGGGR